MASNYIKGDLLGEGTWGEVFKANRKCDGIEVAIKRIKPMDRQYGMNFTALREIKFLREMKNKNVVDLKDVFLSLGVLHLVLEFCPFDLEKIIRDKSIYLRTQHCKSYMQMILRGIEFLHRHYVLHRDLKPANLLIGYDGEIKLADFGLARAHGSPDKMTGEVVTRWYRAPELLFGAQHYAEGVDTWAAGCIFAEIILRIPLFPGDTDIEQLGKIFNVLGTPTTTNWPNVDLLPNYIEFEPREPISLESLFKGNKLSGKGIAADLDLLLKLLTFNPLKRISATEALAHPYFGMDPVPCEPVNLPVPASFVGKLRPATTNVNESVSSKREGNFQDSNNQIKKQRVA